MTRCPICYEAFDGHIDEEHDIEISPGDQLVDHLTDVHGSPTAKLVKEGVSMDV